MSKLDDAKNILKELGLPIAQQNEISAYKMFTLPNGCMRSKILVSPANWNAGSLPGSNKC